MKRTTFASRFVLGTALGVTDPEQTRLERSVEEAATPGARVRALNDLAWHLRSREGPRAHALAKQARSLAVEISDRSAQARATRILSMTMPDPERLQEVFQLAEEAKSLYDEVGDTAGMAGARDFLSSLHEFVGDLAGALELALDALSLARSIHDPIRIGYALSSVGGVLSASGEHESAIEHLSEALEHFQRAEETVGTGRILSRLSQALEAAGRGQEAWQYTERCLEVAHQTRDEWLQGHSLRLMADMRHKAGQISAAETLYRQAIACLPGQPARNILGGASRPAPPSWSRTYRHGCA